VSVRLVGRVEQNNGPVFQRVIHPCLELRAIGDGAGRIVRRTQINHIHMPFGRLGDESVARFARQINQLRVSTGLIRFTGVTGHDVGVHINRINRVADGDFVFMAEDIEDIAGVAFGAVADKNFVVGHLATAVAEIVFGNGGPKPFVTLFRPVAAERLAHGHFVHGFVHRGDGGGRQWLGHVADAATDEALGGFRVGFAKNFYAPADFGKEITGLQFQKMLVQERHETKNSEFGPENKVQNFKRLAKRRRQENRPKVELLRKTLNRPVLFICLRR